MNEIVKKTLLKQFNLIKIIIIMISLLYFLLIMAIGCSFVIFTTGSRNTAILPAPEEDIVIRYKDIGELANLDWADMIIFDTVRYENDFEEVNPGETAWEFLFVKYEKQIYVTGEKGSYWDTIEEKLLLDKRDIALFINLELQRYFLIDRIFNYTANSFIEAIDIFEKCSGEVIEDRSQRLRFIITFGSKDIEDVMEDHHFTEDEKDWAAILISENFVYEMFGEMLDLPGHISVPGGNFFAWPTPTLHIVTSPYGWRVHPVTGERKFHYGVDIAGSNAHGQPVISIADGEVFQVNYSTGAAGYNIRIRHYDDDGHEWQSRYCHLSQMRVTVGQKVKQGDVIGAVGNTGVGTGPHLHLELKFEGQLVDPYLYIR